VQPSEFVAACLYKAGQEHCGAYPATIAAVAEVADVSPVTVRTHRDTLDELAV